MIEHSFCITVLANTQKETALIFAGIDVTLSLSALQILGMPLMKINARGETNNDHSALSVFTGIFLILLFAISKYFIMILFIIIN